MVRHEWEPQSCDRRPRGEGLGGRGPRRGPCSSSKLGGPQSGWPPSPPRTTRGRNPHDVSGTPPARLDAATDTGAVVVPTNRLRLRTTTRPAVSGRYGRPLAGTLVSGVGLSRGSSALARSIRPHGHTDKTSMQHSQWASSELDAPLRGRLAPLPNPCFVVVLSPDKPAAATSLFERPITTRRRPQEVTGRRRLQ